MNAFLCGATTVFAGVAATQGRAWWAVWFTVLAAVNGAAWAGVLP